MNLRSLEGLARASVIAVLVACSPAPEQEIAGACQPAFGGEICTWARTSGATVLALGATVPIAVIENAPATAPMVWPPVPAAVVAMPDPVRSATGVDHLTFYWEPMGHPPGPFLTPHFDFHFYAISDSARGAITCNETGKPDSLPSGYVLPDMDIPGLGLLTGLCVAGMGMHAVEAVHMEGNNPMTGVMILGFYQGQPIFFEPMVSQATLKERRSFSLPIATPAGLARGVSYPTLFEAVYDDSLPGYRFVFTGFTGR